MFYACLKLFLASCGRLSLEPQGSPVFLSLLEMLLMWMMQCWRNLWDLPVEWIETQKNMNVYFVKRGCSLLHNVFRFTNKEKFLGPSIVICFPGILVLCPAHLPASLAISQELCGGSPRHHKSLFVEQELQHKHLLLKNKLSYLLDHVSNSRRMEESGINSEE